MWGQCARTLTRLPPSDGSRASWKCRCAKLFILLFHFSFLFIPLSVFPPTPRTHSLESLSLSYLCSQRAVIRKALAEMLPLGQKTVRGSLNALIYQAKEASPDDDEEEEVDTSEDE